MSDNASRLEAVLGPSGTLAQMLDGYEYRHDQVEMARAVLRALEERRYLVAEAGTGTGKTIAYLVPAALVGRKILISTATKTLQEQIWGKDIPLLRERAGLTLSAAYLKGRANYYCLARGERFALAPTFPNRDEAALWPTIQNWICSTETGDRSEIDLPDQYGAWREISATSENCLGRECQLYEQCFVTRARARASAADIVLVNHHLFFADLAMRTSRAGVEVLPEYEAVIFDEAHALEEIATDFFGLQVSNYRIEELCRDAQRAVGDRPDLASMMKSLTSELAKAGERYFSSVGARLRGLGGGAAGRSRLHHGRPRDDDVRAALDDELMEPLLGEQARLDEALESLRELLTDAPSAALSLIVRRVAELRVELQAVTARKEPSRVYFGETRGRGVFLRAAPIDVSDELAQRLYGRLDTAVFTSATLAAQGRFDYFRRQMGLFSEMSVEQTSFPGPFDYERQAALVTFPAMPDPSRVEFVAAAAKAVEELTGLTHGRAFVLCTSTRGMLALYEACRRLPYRLLLQGERPKHRLIEELKAEPSVLFATASFWEGVDVPGDALSLVVIDRLPFAPPGDPVVAARLSAIEREGLDPFGEMQVPAAALALRQGFGRLIRTKTDRGLVAILDPRIVTRSYGRAFFATLPRCPVLRSIEEAANWWNGTAQG